jgi:hypothetical protein
MCLLKFAPCPTLRAGKRASLVSEHFAFKQGVRQGRAIDLYKRFIAAVGFGMKLHHHYFFANTGFATNKYIERGIGDALNLLADCFNVCAYTY